MSFSHLRPHEIPQIPQSNISPLPLRFYCLRVACNFPSYRLYSLSLYLLYINAWPITLSLLASYLPYVFCLQSYI